MELRHIYGRIRENTAYKRPFTVAYGTKTAVYDKVTGIYGDLFWPTRVSEKHQKTIIKIIQQYIQNKLFKLTIGQKMTPSWKSIQKIAMPRDTV